MLRQPFARLLPLVAAMIAGCGGQPVNRGAASPDSLFALETLLAPATTVAPQVSPDGRWISFLRPVDGAMNLFVAPADTISAARPVTRRVGRGLQPFDVSEKWNLHVVDIGSGAEQNLTPLPIRGPDGDGLAGTGMGWSSRTSVGDDGEGHGGEVLELRQRPGVLGVQRVRVVSAPDSSDRPIARIGTNDSMRHSSLQWLTPGARRPRLLQISTRRAGGGLVARWLWIRGGRRSPRERRRGAGSVRRRSGVRATRRLMCRSDWSCDRMERRSRDRHRHARRPLVRAGGGLHARFRSAGADNGRWGVGRAEARLSPGSPGRQSLTRSAALGERCLAPWLEHGSRGTVNFGPVAG